MKAIICKRYTDIFLFDNPTEGILALVFWAERSLSRRSEFAIKYIEYKNLNQMKAPHKRVRTPKNALDRLSCIYTLVN